MISARLDRLRFYYDCLGVPGKLGLLAVLGALVYLAAVVQPKAADLRERVLHNEQLRIAIAREQAQADMKSGANAHSPALAPEAADVLRHLNEIAARAGLELERGEYRLTDARGAKYRAYQFTFPIYGSYSEVRDFLTRALNDVPALALVSVQMRRDSIDSSELEAVLGFTLYLGAAT